MPRTVQVLLVGFAMLAVLAVLGRIIGGQEGMLKMMGWFLPIWLVLTVYNMLEGIRAGHSFVSEIPFLLINFGVPMLLAYGAMKLLAK